VDAALAAELRARIVAGTATPAELRAELRRYVAPVDPEGRDADDQYDGLDTLVGAALGLAEPAGPIGELPPDMVAYQPTPARWLLALAEGGHLSQQDTFVDIGSGLGQPAILAALLSGAQAIGIEIEPAYVAVARRCAASLGLTHVVFRAEDVLRADLRAGTLFYLYTPLLGPPLRQMLDRLRTEAAARPIRLCAYGPCTPAVAAERWVKEVARCGPLRIFRSERG
jgi:SAM-dependent methyltransferase